MPRQGFRLPFLAANGVGHLLLCFPAPIHLPGEAGSGVWALPVCPWLRRPPRRWGDPSSPRGLLPSRGKRLTCNSVWEKATGRALAEGGWAALLPGLPPGPPPPPAQGSSEGPAEPRVHRRIMAAGPPRRPWASLDATRPGPALVHAPRRRSPRGGPGGSPREEAPACSPHRDGSTSHHLQRCQVGLFCKKPGGGPSASRAGAGCGGPGNRWVAPAAWTSPAGKPGPTSVWPRNG